MGRLAQWRDKQLIKILSGIRGCGKTTLLALYIDWLKRSGIEDEQIMYVSLEDAENESLQKYQGLYSYIKKRLCVGKWTYVFIDELQKCANYEKAIEGLMLKKLPQTGMGLDLYAAVSQTLTFENTPHIEVRVLPLSFAEYQASAGLRIASPHVQAAYPEGNLDVQSRRQVTEKPGRRLPRQRAQMEKYLRQEEFNNYLSFGGFPFTAYFGGDAGLIRQCAEGIFNTVLVKDIARQGGIYDIPLLEHIAQLMSQSLGRPLSSKKLSTVIGRKGRKISSNTVETYMRALSAAFVFYHADRFDIKTGKRLKTLGKYYACDLGMRNMLMAAAEPSLDSQLENIVYLELLRRGYQVCIGKYRRDEINFVAIKKIGITRERAYFQVAASVRDSSVLAAKLSPLERIGDKLPKYILSLDDTPFRAVRKGIILQNVIDWLLNPVPRSSVSSP